MVGITLLVPGHIPYLSTLVLELLSISQPLFLYLLHMDHQHRYAMKPISMVVLLSLLDKGVKPRTNTSPHISNHLFTSLSSRGKTFPIKALSK